MAPKSIEAIQKEFDEGTLSREDYKEAVALAQGRPSYKETKKAQSRESDVRLLNELEAQLKELRARLSK